MRSLLFCALLGALTDLPVSHGFPSGNILSRSLHAGGYRVFPRSPNPFRARVAHAQCKDCQDGSSGYSPRSSLAVNLPRADYVLPEPLEQ